MVNSPTIEMIYDWKNNEALAAHNALEEFRKPDLLNDLILTKLNLVVEQLAGQGDATAVRVDLATLTQLIQLRKLRNVEVERGQARSWR